MELWQILLITISVALMIGLVTYGVVMYCTNHKEYAINKRMNRVISTRKVLKELNESKKWGRSSCVFDGKVDQEIIKKIKDEGHNAEEYTDYRGFPCTRVSFKK